MRPDLQEWVPEDRLVHFIMEVVGLLDWRDAKIHEPERRSTREEGIARGAAEGAEKNHINQ